MAQVFDFDIVNEKKSTTVGAPETRTWLEECFLGVETPVPIGAKNASGERQVLDMSADGLLVDVAKMVDIAGDVGIFGAFGGLAANSGGESIDSITVTAGETQVLDQEPTSQPSSPAYLKFTLGGATTSADVTYTVRGNNEYGGYKIKEYTIAQSQTEVTSSDKWSNVDNISVLLSTTEASSVVTTVTTAATSAVSPSEPQVAVTSEGIVKVILDNSQPLKVETSLVFDGEVVTLENIKTGWDGSNNTFLKTNASGVVSVQFDSAQPVSATDLDIRDLTSASDSVEVLQDTPSDLRSSIWANTVANGSGSWLVPIVDASGHLQIDVLTLPTLPAGDNNIGNVDVVTLPADVDIRDLLYTQDSITSYQGGTWNVTIDNASIAVTATDLDIRDLTNASDSVLAYGYDGSTNRALLVDEGGRLQVDIIDGSITMDDLDHLTDDVGVWFNTAKDGTGTWYIPIVDADGHQQVDVLSMPTVTVQATQLDIDDLVYTTDSVTAHQGGTWTVDAVQSGTWNVGITGTVTVQATDLDIRDLSSATDSVSAVQSGTWTVDAVQSGTWNVTIDNASLTIDATDLDIRDLLYSQDSVAVWGNDGTTDRQLKTNTSGQLEVVIVEDQDDTYAEFKNAAVAITGGAGSQVGSYTLPAPTNNLGVMLIVDAGGGTGSIGDLYIQDSDGTKIWRRRLSQGFFSETKLDVPLIGAVVIGVENGTNLPSTITIKMKYEV